MALFSFVFSRKKNNPCFEFRPQYSNGMVKNVKKLSDLCYKKEQMQKEPMGVTVPHHFAVKQKKKQRKGTPYIQKPLYLLTRYKYTNQSKRTE